MPFQTAATFAGNARVFHPRGLVATGRMKLSTEWWTVESGTPIEMVARLSRGAGTPTGVPDMLGLTIKIPLAVPGTQWDLLLASSGASAVTRPRR
ncbi:hypothetical protein ACFTZB_31145 [Rhodococcus sp. NPDC057014]|uniref:hypothetical protein n=1 Tax=Rhodococcus sp. NPDC057014 TaxID=3346000 RepID=UPI00362F42F6